MVFAVSRARALVSVLCVTAIVAGPLSALAKTRDISDVVQATAPTVSRGDFLRWSVELFELEAGEDCTLTYKRVPKSMETTLCAAQEVGALKSFGQDLQLSQPILRGEALVVITAITKQTSSDQDVSAYRDVTTAAMKSAVQNALKHRWMNADSATSFGIARKLTGAEALSTLSAATGKQTSQQKRGTTVRIRFDGPKSTSTTSTTGVSSDVPGSELLRTVWQLIQRDYLRSDAVDQKELGYAVIEGLVKGLNDPYTNFFRPVAANNFQTQIKGELSGIGAHVEEQAGQIVVVAPLPGTPAEKAGLKTGDIVLEADGKTLTGIGIDNAIELIRGPRGSSVKLKIRRGTDEFIVSIVRDTISIPEIEVSWKDNVAIVKIVQFGQTTDTKVRDLMKQIAGQNPRGIVLDLRNNPGGLLHAASVVVSNFMPSGTVVAQVKGRTSSATEVTEEEPTISASTKLSVLVNEGSASASEIVAGALQDHGRAKIIGVTTFGKGTVQELLTFTSGEAIKMTIAEWLTPKGRKINGVGVVPDIVVENAEQQLQRAITEAK